ncbi:Hypothetical predicted protein [Pelobates cultripes]|uniref:Uncharacterized protein n=1 Tax=Pelobates cultripes TaxID=61616 RepID=A0AAD1QZ79_PELCU|nr:Hypothetical predicted protein [Pelobates cultripes]
MASKTTRKSKSKTPSMQITAFSSPGKRIQDGAGEIRSPTSESEHSESGRSDITSVSRATALQAGGNNIPKLLEDLKTTIRSDFQKLAADIRKEVQAIGEHTAHLEDKT